jgi:cytosine/creatinine deaminase
MAGTLIVENAIAAGGGDTELVVVGGRIAALGAGAGAGVVAPPGAERVDAGGRLLLPGLVEGHVHLDKTLIGLPFTPHIPGASIASRIAAEKLLRKNVPLSIVERGGRLLDILSGFGAVAVRSHVDVDTEVGLRGLEALVELKDTYADRVDLQIVAFPQSGILADPGVAELLRAAAASGADLVGGLDPCGIDADPKGHLDLVFAVADMYGVGVDIHLHDGGRLGSWELRLIAERTVTLGLAGRVAVSHAFCLGELDDFDFATTSEALARSGVSIMTTGPGPVPMPPVKRLREAGVRVFSGNDNIRDTWSPFGTGDLLERAAIVCDRQNFRADDDLELAFRLVSEEAALATGLGTGRLEIGGPGDFLLVAARSIAEAIALKPQGRAVFKRGVQVAG